MKPRVRCCALVSDEGPHFPALEEAGFEVLPGNRERNLWKEEDLIDELEGCAAVIAGSEPYTPRVIQSLPALRIIARTGVGFDAVDLAACDAQTIVVATTPGVNHHSVAEHTIAMLLGLARGFPGNDQQVRQGIWRRVPRPRVMGSTIGVIGLGRIGKAVITRAAGLGMNVLGCEPCPDDAFCRQWNVEVTTLDDLLSRSDYVTMHNPSTPESRYMMNAERFAKMKPDSIFINTARGSLVDEQALYDALKSGRLRGAGLDVFDVEPLATDHPLLEFDNVMFAGHLAGLDVESQRDTLLMSADTIIGLRNGRWPGERIQNLKAVDNWEW